MHMVIANAVDRRSLSDRHADPVHGEHGVELVDEHGGHARHAAPRRTPTASTRSRSSSLPTRSSRRPWRFADLVLPDTTYLERYDAISLLDRPISEPDAAADAIRHPIVELDRDVRPWQDVLVELASRLKLPGVHQARRHAQVRATTRTSSSLREVRRASASSPAGAARTANRTLRRRAESAAVGDVHREPVVLRVPLAGVDAVVPLRQPRLPRVREEGTASARRHRADRHADLVGAAAEIPAGRGRGTTTGRGRPIRPTRERLADVLRSAADLVSAARNAARPTADDVSAARDHAAADDDVPLVGLAERVAAPDPVGRIIST